MAIMQKSVRSDKFVTPVGRIRGINLDISVEDQWNQEKKEYNGKKQNTYQVELMLPKTDPLAKEFFKKMQAMEESLIVKGFGKKFKVPHPSIKDGDESDNENLHGFYILKAKRKAAEDKPLPILLNDRKGQITEIDTFYSGCWARMQVQLKTYEFKGAKGVTVELLTLQFARDDEPLFSSIHGESLDAIDTVEEYDTETDELLGDAA